ncbi:MAG: primosomal protein N' [Patescibacteria group bacterium]
MYAQVVPLRRMPRALSVLDYGIPRGMTVYPGALVRIPLRKRTDFGIVHAMTEQTRVTKGIHDIESVTFPHLLSAQQLALAEDIARRYATPLTLTIVACCPPLQPRKLAAATLVPFVTPPKHGFERRYVWYRNSEEKKRWFGEHWPRENEQTLIIVPEKWHLREWEDIVGSHTTITSDLSPKEYFKQYFAIRNGETAVVLGTKSALFAPFHNLRHVIVDFEHSPHHKNWDQAPRYHARDAAIRLAELWQCPVTVMSHTPSVESAMHLAAHASMRAAHATRALTIVDLAEEYKKKNFGIFSDAAQEALHRAAEERKDIVALVHRRGAYTTVACRECGRVERCANCTLPLIYHERDQQLHCHPCHRTQPLRELCAFCKGPHVAFRGAGTQAVETALREALCDTPYTIHRIDGDTDVPHFNVERPAAVVGTSRALSHVRWGRVGLVCANDIDGFLALPEYRATAEFVGLIRDVQYLMPARATMLLQTREPHRPVLDALGSGMLEPWYREELHLREQLHYPPFWSILKLTHWGASPEESRAAAAFIVAALTRLTAGAKNAILTHPYPTHPPIRKGLYGLIVLLRMPHEQAREQFPALLEQLALPDVWKVDVDPLTLL